MGFSGCQKLWYSCLNILPTALSWEGMQLPPPICPSVCPSVSTLSFEPTDLWPWLIACVGGHYHGSQGIETEGDRSRSRINAVGLISILDRGPFCFEVISQLQRSLRPASVSCMWCGHYHGSQRIETEGHRSRSMVTVVGLTSILDRGQFTSCLCKAATVYQIIERHLQQTLNKLQTWVDPKGSNFLNPKQSVCTSVNFAL